MIYDFITNMYFTGMTHGGMIHLSRAKEPEVFRGFWLFFALVSICRLREIPLIVIVISLRICDRVEEALSLTLPNLSRILSIFPINWGKTKISPANSVKAGYLISSSSMGLKKRTMSLIVCKERLRSNNSRSSSQVPSGRIRFKE